MSKILFFLIFIVMGCGFILTGILLLHYRLNTPKDENVSHNTFLRFFWWLGVILGVGNIAMSLFSFFMAVLVLTYPF